ncbi:MAG: hypothetical protein OER77_08690 [Myxococcales bacterium]|nr:hypothetical protein [Myxococcales bacterium]
MNRRIKQAIAGVCLWWVIAGAALAWSSAALACEMGWTEYSSETCSRANDFTFGYTGGFSIR